MTKQVFYTKLKELVKELGESNQGADFLMAYGGQVSSRAPTRPAVVFDGEVAEDESEVLGTIHADLYLPPAYYRWGTESEDLLTQILEKVREYFPCVVSVSRSSARGQGGKVVIPCSISIGSRKKSCRFWIDGKSYEANSLTVTWSQQSREFTPIGSGEAAFSYSTDKTYRGEILGCDLEGADLLPTFTLESGAYLYQGCLWTSLLYSSKDGQIEKAKFTACSRTNREQGGSV